MIKILKIDKKTFDKLCDKPLNTVLTYKNISIKYGARGYDGKQFYQGITIKSNKYSFEKVLYENIENYLIYNEKNKKCIIIEEFIFNYFKNIIDYDYIAFEDFKKDIDI